MTIKEMANISEDVIIVTSRSGVYLSFYRSSSVL